MRKHLLSWCFRTFFLLVLLTAGNAVYAGIYVEDFSTSTGSDESLRTLPEGWGTIGTVASYTDFGRSTAYFNLAAPSIACTGGNTGNYIVSPTVKGSIGFYLCKATTSSSAKANVKVYEAVEGDNGVLTITGEPLLDVVPPAGQRNVAQSMTRYSITADRPMRLAFLLSRSAIDDFVAEERIGDSGSGNGGEEEPVEKEALKVVGFQRTTDYECTANEKNEFSVSFDVIVKNTGNVALTAEKTSISITNADGDVLQTATASEALEADATVTIPVTVTMNAGEGGYFSFYVKENLTGTYCLNTYGNPDVQNVHVTGYYATFSISEADGFALDSDDVIDFGYTKADITKSFVVTNQGTAPLQVSAITVPAGFSVSESSLTVAAGTTSEFTVTLTAQQEPYGEKQGALSLTHSLGTFAVNITGTTVNPELFFENFEGGQMPEEWEAGASWSISSLSDNHFALQNNLANEPSRLITPRLKVVQGEQMTFQARRSYATDAAELRVFYSSDKENWTQIGDFGSELTRDYSGRSYKTITISQVPEGNYYIAFEGLKTAIDNVAGYHPFTEEPVMAVTDADNATVEDGAVKDFGEITQNVTALYNINNVGTGTLKATVTTTGDITADKNSVELGEGKSTTLTVSMPMLPYGAKQGTLTIAAADGKSLTITLKGESKEPDGIAHRQTTTNHKPTTHNINGQRTTANGLRGIVIENGKKIIKK